MKKYGIAYSKTDEDTILEDGHGIKGIIPRWDTLDSKKCICELLNNKEKKINELELENKKLRWYFEELRCHVPKDKLEQIDLLYGQLEKNDSLR